MSTSGLKYSQWGKKTKTKKDYMIKSIVADTIIESSDKQFTNHSARKIM